jgi:predicted CoA-binding protein
MGRVKGGIIMDLKTAVEAFLLEKRVAVVGVSRNPQETANAIYRHFKANGYAPIPVNPAAEKLEGAPCYPSVKAIPGGVGAAMLVTTPAVSAQVAQDCVDAGVKWVWMHRSFGDSVSEDAVALLREQGVGVIPGGCPFMFLEPDPFHKALCWFLQATRRLPRAV